MAIGIAGKEGLGAAAVVVLAGEADQVVIECWLAAIETFTVVRFADGCFNPAGCQVTRALASDIVAARSLAFGAGGFSRTSSTFRLSRALNCRYSARSITDAAAG